MRLPTLQGLIDRRMLVNFTADPDVVQRILPAPFRPQVFKGKAIVGICLIRLKQIRPKGFPTFIGISSENGAHRIAVEWEENGEIKNGVFIPRRDSSSWLNTLAGGRVFPGKHYHADFDVREGDGHYHIAFTSSDGTRISVDAESSPQLEEGSIFTDLQTASDFFKGGSVGYSPNGNRHEGMKLNTRKWEVKPLKVSKVHSSFFEDPEFFPKGSVHFDNALLMTRIEHEWETLEPRKIEAPASQHLNT